MLSIFDTFHKIIIGWNEVYYHYKNWQYLLRYPYNHYATWEFFSLLNLEIQKPYTLYLNQKDYDKWFSLMNECDIEAHL